MRTDVVQKAVVLNSEGKMLILRRSKTDVRRPLEWDIPGGLLEPGEDQQSGLEREIFEESALNVKDARIVFTKTGIQKWPEGEANVVRIYYIANAINKEVTLSNEHSEHKWVTFEQAIKEIDYSRHKEVLHYILDNKLVL